MRRHSLMLMASAMALLAVGCTSGENQASNNEASPSPSPEASQSPTATQPFDQPLISEKGKAGDKDKKGTKDVKKVAKNKIPGLLQSTDPDERAKRVQAGIKSGRAGLDPFASLPPILTFKTPIPADSVANGGRPGGGSSGGFGSGGGFGPGRSPLGGQRGTLPGLGGNGTSIATGPGSVPSIPSFPEANEIRPPRPVIARNPTAAGGSSRGGGSSVAAVPMSPGGRPGTSENPGLKPLPPIPEPTLARAVEVSGVVTLGGLTQAIVKAPNEPTSRHVTVGQRLSNGQVLVKRIEVNSGSDPIVVLEENGVEVARSVGEKATPADPGGVPTAFVPQSAVN
jgi:hypothetical protein